MCIISIVICILICWKSNGRHRHNFSQNVLLFVNFMKCLSKELNKDFHFIHQYTGRNSRKCNDFVKFSAKSEICNSWNHCYYTEIKQQSTVWDSQNKARKTKWFTILVFQKRSLACFVSRAEHFTTIRLGEPRTINEERCAKICTSEGFLEERKKVIEFKLCM